MKRTVNAFMGVTLALVLHGSAYGSACSCTAKDGSCSISIDCGGCGCICSCARNGGCTCDCLCQSPALLVGDNGPASSATFVKFFDGQVSSEDSPMAAMDVANLLGRTLHAQVTFTPSDPLMMLSFHNISARQLIGRLATTGEVTINGSKVRSAEGLGSRLDLDQPISIDAKGANAAAFARVLSRVLGRRVEFASDTITGTMDLDAKDATVRDVLQHLARLGTVRIDGERLILADRRK
jgi:hypothetical protein